MDHNVKENNKFLRNMSLLVRKDLLQIMPWFGHE